MDRPNALAHMSGVLPSSSAMLASAPGVASIRRTHLWSVAPAWLVFKSRSHARVRRASGRALSLASLDKIHRRKWPHRTRAHLSLPKYAAAASAVSWLAPVALMSRPGEASKASAHAGLPLYLVCVGESSTRCRLSDRWARLFGKAAAPVREGSQALARLLDASHSSKERKGAHVCRVFVSHVSCRVGEYASGHGG